MQKTTLASRRFSIKKSRCNTKDKIFAISHRNYEIELKNKIVAEIVAIEGDKTYGCLIEERCFKYLDIGVLNDYLCMLKNDGKGQLLVSVEKHLKNTKTNDEQRKDVVLDSDSKLSIAFLVSVFIAAIVFYSYKIFS